MNLLLFAWVEAVARFVRDRTTDGSFPACHSTVYLQLVQTASHPQKPGGIVVRKVLILALLLRKLLLHWIVTKRVAFPTLLF